MSYHSTICEADLQTEAQSEPDDASEPLHVAVHALAQPLTALAFLLELARFQTDPEALRGALSDAAEECKRACLALDAIRGAVHALNDEGRQL